MLLKSPLYHFLVMCFSPTSPCVLEISILQSSAAVLRLLISVH